MQDNTNKQYFDIKGPSNPDPTSRPVINTEPIQVDPMVSTTQTPAQAPDLSSNVMSNGDLDLSLPDLPEDNATTPGNTSQSEPKIAATTAIATPPVVNTVNTNEVSQPSTETASSSVNQSDTATIDTQPSTSTAATSTVKSDTELNQSKPISTSLLQPIEKPKVNDTTVTTPIETKPKIDQSVHVQKHNNHLMLKVLLGFLILVVIGLTSYLVYKVKFGQ